MQMSFVITPTGLVKYVMLLSNYDFTWRILVLQYNYLNFKSESELFYPIQANANKKQISTKRDESKKYPHQYIIFYKHSTLSVFTSKTYMYK